MYHAIAKLKESIDSIVSDDNGLSIFYSKRFGVPEQVSKQYIKQRISRLYNMKNNSYERVLQNRSVILSSFKLLAYYIVVIFRSKVVSSERSKYDIIIDDIQQLHELSRWNALEEEFSSNKTLFVSKIHVPVDVCGGHNVYFQKPMSGYSAMVLRGIGVHLVFSDLFYLVKSSFRLGINLVQIHIHYLNDYLYYKTIFELFFASYLIQDRNLGRTNALKNYLFKQSGGVKTACIQKNIIQMNGNALYYDIDTLFTFGNRSADGLGGLGGSIGEIVPVGSFAMESAVHHLIEVDKKRNIDKNAIDVLFIGINVVYSKRTDWSGYYEAVSWISRLSNEYPEHVVRIKHHATSSFDPYEHNLLAGSLVEYVDSDLNSYTSAAQSRIVVTFGSTMGYELIGFGHEVFFLDPLDNNPMVSDFLHEERRVIVDYGELSSLIKNGMNGLGGDINRLNYCIPSRDVSKSIYRNLVAK